MFNLTFQAAKDGFFDRQRVQAAVDRSTRKVFSKFGAFVRQRARTSIKKRKGISPPGAPPFSHVGLLRRFILFAFDVNQKSVVIGPTLLRDSATAPRLLEHGGETILPTSKERRVAHYRPRPYMGPAFEKEIPSLPALWQHSVR
ncbi:MAG: hypothetical protein K8T89_04365 [Planctomycetes bacterium]|nr:hypothetical protein [Planctomycetota bacterium]